MFSCDAISLAVKTFKLKLGFLWPFSFFIIVIERKGKEKQGKKRNFSLLGVGWIMGVIFWLSLNLDIVKILIMKKRGGGFSLSQSLLVSFFPNLQFPTKQDKTNRFQLHV